MKLNFSLDASSINKCLLEMEHTEDRLKTALLMLCRTASQQMAEYAKDNARWIDRTGDARKLLQGEGYWDNDKLTAAVMHNVNYGVWLELAHQRKYAILEESVKSKADELLRSYKRLVG